MNTFNLKNWNDRVSSILKHWLVTEQVGEYFLINTVSLKGWWKLVNKYCLLKLVGDHLLINTVSLKQVGEPLLMNTVSPKHHMASNTKNRFRLVRPVSTMAAAQFVPPPSKQRSRMQNWTFQVGATDPNRTRVTNHNHATQSGLHPCSLFCCKWALLKREQSCISGRESGMWREKKMHPQNLMQTCETLKFYRTRLVCINQRINLLRPVPVDSTGASI